MHSEALDQLEGLGSTTLGCIKGHQYKPRAIADTLSRLRDFALFEQMSKSKPRSRPRKHKQHNKTDT